MKKILLGVFIALLGFDLFGCESQPPTNDEPHAGVIGGSAITIN